ncbi:hypothetical protein AVEN_169749-1 [Araneus ventricosus]|uniref:Uncharacterized protein n=1 Tax=Araneus ventricosus TaxID=182803 RepID=A0A4Y2N1E6_ARAVE|nr:hypothetical protein AVEN_169749-1 [Araneus ventricosus]
MVITPPEVRPCYHTSRGVATIHTSRGSTNGYHTSRVATMVITPQRVATMIVTPRRKVARYTSGRDRDHDPSFDLLPAPPEVATMVITPQRVACSGYHLPEGRDHDYHTSERVALVIHTSGGPLYHEVSICITPPEGATLFITPLRRDLTMVITPQGSRPWLSHLQRGHDVVINTSRGSHGDLHLQKGSTVITPQRVGP